MGGKLRAGSGEARPHRRDRVPSWLRGARVPWRDLRSSLRADGVAADARASWQQTRSSLDARRAAPGGSSAWRTVLGVGSVVLEVVFGPEPPRPPSTATRLAWLRRNWAVVLWLATIGMYVGTVAWLADSTRVWAPAAPFVAAALVLPLGLAAATPLRAWRLLVVVGAAAPLVVPPAQTAAPVDGPPWPPTLIFVALYVLYALALRADLRLLIPVWLITSAVISWSYIVGEHRNPTGSTNATIIGVTVLLVFGYLIGNRRRMQRELAEGRQLAREEQARSALLEERARIARELHDVVAHHMSVIAVRAESAPFRIPGLPGPVKDDFAETSAIAREALTEMRRLLGVLRGADTDAARAPQPSLDRLDGLVAGVRRAGTAVEVRVIGDARALPPGVELSAFRIVQEALSNVLRHAPGAPASVEVAYEPDRLRIRVHNAPPPGGTGAPAPSGRGHGIIGMRERATMLGGQLTVGPTAQGGYLVEAALPLPGQEQGPAPGHDPGPAGPAPEPKDREA